MPVVKTLINVYAKTAKEIKFYVENLRNTIQEKVVYYSIFGFFLARSLMSVVFLNWFRD